MNYVSRIDAENCPLLFFVDNSGPKNLVFSINDRYYSIGRALSNHLIIVEAGVSRLHAVIYKEGDLCYLENLSETSHTAVNGQKLKKKIQLVANDVIEIADLKLKFLPNKGYLNNNTQHQVKDVIKINRAPNSGVDMMDTLMGYNPNLEQLGDTKKKKWRKEKRKNE